MKIHIVVLLGPPGSGKGTQAKAVVGKNKDWLHVSTGDLFRAEIKSGSELGKDVQSIIDAGNLVSDAITNQVFESQLKALVAKLKPKVVLLDGYPRTGVQTRFLLELLAREKNFMEPLVMEFDVEDSVIVERLSGRRINPRTGRIYHVRFNPPKLEGICDDDGQELITRPDDNANVVRSRIQKYKDSKKEILDGFKGSGAFVRVMANKEPELLSEEVEKLIREHQAVFLKG